MDLEATRAHLTRWLPRVYEPLAMTFNDEVAETPDGRWVVGSGGYALSIVLEPDNGSLYVTPEDGIGPEQFLNTGVVELGRCLSAFDETVVFATETGEEADRLLALEEFEKRVSEIDLAALNNPENYWPVIVEQIGYGLL